MASATRPFEPGANDADESTSPVAAGIQMRRFSATILRWSTTLLVAATWVSGAIFGFYILSFFGGMAASGAAQRWNESLPGLQDGARPLANLAIGLHFAAGGILLLLGPIQLMSRVRQRLPTLHRGLGRAYVACAACAGIGGLAFIATQGTIGGAPMSIGFGLYGSLMLLCAIQAYRHARARRLDIHQRWAVRLFALAVGSWLYRMEYGFWFLVVGQAGHTAHFSGWFDIVMAFFFYLPNLVVAEVIVRSRRRASNAALDLPAAAVVFAAALFVIVATWAFAKDYWVPGITDGLAAAARHA